MLSAAAITFCLGASHFLFKIGFILKAFKDYHVLITVIKIGSETLLDQPRNEIANLRPRLFNTSLTAIGIAQLPQATTYVTIATLCTHKKCDHYITIIDVNETAELIVYHRQKMLIASFRSIKL